MRKFIILSILFAIPIFLGFLFIEIMLRGIDNDYSYKSDFLERNAKNIDILILGSSHGYYGIEPSCFEMNSFNAAHVSQTLDLDYHILSKYVENMDSLKIVILPISYFTMISDLNTFGEDFRKVNYVLEYDLKSNNIKHHLRVMNLSFNTNLKKLKSKITKNKNDIVCSQSGFGLMYKLANKNKRMDMDKSGKDRANYHHAKGDSRLLFDYNKKSLNNILELCNSRNMCLILLTTPVWTTYKENLNPEQLFEMTNLCDSIAFTNRNVFYMNMMDDHRFHEDDFYDADHLSDVGAKKLTSILNDTIKYLFIKNE